MPEKECQMKGRSVFYIVAWMFLAVMLGNAGYRSLKPGFVDMSKYPQMSFEERLAEADALHNESEQPTRDASKYFEMVYRFEKLDKAMSLAHIGLATRGPAIPNRAFDQVGLRFDENQYVNRMQSMYEFSDNIRARAETDPFAIKAKEMGFRDVTPMDPATPRAWFAVYLAIVLLQFGHFVIRIEEMGGSWLLAITDIRFYFWGLVPGGATKYPTNIDVVAGVKRAYRFAVAFLGASLSLAAAGCAGKRVKTDPEEGRPTQAPIAWHANMNTTVWPTYIGGNGAVFHPAPVVQSSATIAHTSGTYASLWWSDPLTHTNSSPNFARELDGSLGWAGKIPLGLIGSVDLTWVGVTPVAQYAGDVLQLSLGVSRPVEVHGHSVTPYFTYRHAEPTMGKNPGKGSFSIWGARTGWKAGPLDGAIRAELMTDTGTFGFARRMLVDGGGSVGMNIGKDLRAEAPLRWYIPVSGPPDGRKPELQSGLSLVWKH